jgi:hypothetical protein
MKYALECIVESTMKMPPNTRAEWEGRTVVFLPNAEGVFARIRITADVPEPLKCRTWCETKGDPRKTLNVHLHKDDALHANLLADLQVLEAALASQCPVGRIRWHSALMVFIPETPEEEQQIQVNNICIAPGADQPEQITECEVEKFVAGIHIADKCRDLVGPLSFLREGNSFFKQFRNIQAFFNFYFVLESLYGGGEYEKRKIKAKFMQSKTLTGAIELQIRRGFPRPYDLRNQDIEAMLKKCNKQADVEGLVHLLVSTRGELHHYLNPKKHTGTPLTDDQYECLAKFTGEVTMAALTQETRQRLFKAES